MRNPPVLSACAQAAHRHHMLILHLAFALVLLDLGQHVAPFLRAICDHFGLTACGQTGAVLATACEYLRGAEPAA